MNWFGEITDIIREAESLGSRVLDNGVRLIGHAPHVGPEAYLHEVYAPLDDAGVAEIEAKVRRPLPPELKAFYRHANGMHVFSGALSIDGLRRSYVRRGDGARQPFNIETPNVDERPADADDAMVYFGSYSWDGSHLCMRHDAPEVYCVKRWGTEILHQWPDFEHMILSELQRLKRMFDASGKKRDKDLPTTPF